MLFTTERQSLRAHMRIFAGPHYLDNRLSAMADLGWGVLDANVEVTTSILNHQPPSNRGVFIDSREVDADSKVLYILDSICAFCSGLEKDRTFCEKGSSFQHLPNAVVGYDFPEFLIVAFMECPSLERSGLKANQGHALKADKHFRLWWEISSPTSMGFVARMFNGSGFAPYCTTLHDCVLADVPPESLPKDSATVIRIGYSCCRVFALGKRGEFLTHVLPRNHIFTKSKANQFRLEKKIEHWMHLPFSIHLWSDSPSINIFWTT